MATGLSIQEGIAASLTSVPSTPIENAAFLSSLTTVLRQAYTTGRTSRRILYALINIAKSSDYASSYRVMAFEVLWSVVAQYDTSPLLSSALLSTLLASTSPLLTSADSADLSLCALDTFAHVNPASVYALLLQDDVERSFVEAMTGDAASSVRARSVCVFGRFAFIAAMQSALLTDGNTNSLGYGVWPVDSHGAFSTLQSRLFDKAAEILKGVCTCLEDNDVEVAQAAVYILRSVFDSCPSFSVATTQASGKASGVLVPVDTLASRIFGHNMDVPAVLCMKEAHRKLVNEIMRRLSGKIVLLMPRMHSLTDRGRAHAIRLFTLILAHLASDAGGSGRLGVLDPPTVLRVDHCASGGFPAVHELLYAWMTAHVHRYIRGSHSVAHVGGVGTGHSLEKSNTSSSLNELSAANASVVCNFEAVRSVTQLAVTWTSNATHHARFAAGYAAVADLQAVSPPAPQIGATRATADSSAAIHTMHAGLWNVASVGSMLSAPLGSVPSSADANSPVLLTSPHSSGFCGPLWPAIYMSSAPPAAARATVIAAAVTAAFRHILPDVLYGIFHLLRRVYVVPLVPGAGGVIVATAGLLNGGLGSAASPASLISTEASLVGASGAPLSQQDPAVLAAAGAVVTAGTGMLGSGASSALISPSLLQKLLGLAVSCLCMSPTDTVIRYAPAVCREIGKIPDDVRDDVGTGLHHSLSRVSLLFFMISVATRVTLHEAAPKHPLEPYIGGNSPAPVRVQANSSGELASPRQTEKVSRFNFARRGGSGVGQRGGAATVATSAVGGPSNTPPSPYANLVTHSLVLPRIAFEATRPVTHAAPDIKHSSANVLNALPHLSVAGAVHALEGSQACTRFRCEMAAVVLQSLCRACPSTALLTRLADVGRGTDLAHAATVKSRVEDAEAMHTWLSTAIDALAFYIWLLEHRLSYCGVGTMSRDQAAATLAKIMGQPDAPALCPAPVSHSPPSSLYAEIEESPSSGDVAGRTGTSTAGGSAGIGYVTGWAWQREYEACAEASDAFMGLLTTISSLLHPPALSSTYGSITQAGHASPGASLSTALALDIMPPALLALHRSRLARVLYACSKADCGVYRMYELERAAQATAPKVATAAAAAVAQHSLTASVTRGSTFDVLPSAVPLQLRLLWLLASVWDGTDGVSNAGFAGVGSLIAQAHQGGTMAGGASTTSSVTALNAVGSAATMSGLAITATDALLRHSTLATSTLQTALKDVISKTGSPNPRLPASAPQERSLLALALTTEETASLAMEALRQKRLAALVGLIAGEAGVALGIGTDLESAGNKVVALLAAAQASGAANVGEQHAKSTISGLRTFSLKPETAPTPSKATPVSSAAAASSTATPTKGSAGGDAAGSSWFRGSKIGKALGFFGANSSKNSNSLTSVVTQPVVYAGEGTVVTYAHFWLLIDMLSQLAASQRCCAGQIKRAVECMLVQPKLSADVAHTLLALVPRLSLFAAAYGRSSVAKEFAVLDSASGGAVVVGAKSGGSQLGSCGPTLRAANTSTAIVAAVAAEARCAATDPWSFTHYNPAQTIALDGTAQDQSKEPIVAAALAQIQQYKRLVGAQSKRDAPSGVSALEVMADMLSPPTLALVAAAAAPDLTQNATLGLNRSCATGARMRTVPPVSAAYIVDAAASAAAVALDRMSRSGAKPVLGLPAPFVGSVPANLTEALEDSQQRLHDLQALDASPAGDLPRRVAESVAAGASVVERQFRLLDVFTRPNDGSVATATSRVPFLHGVSGSHLFAIAGADGVAPATEWGRLSLLDASMTSGIVLTAPSDPLTLIASHVVHPEANRMSVTLRVINEMAFALPAGTKLQLQLSGPATFDRAAITASQLASSSQRLGSSGVGNANTATPTTVAAGTAASNSALQSDLVTMQRGTCSHALFTISRSLPPGFIVSFCVTFDVIGFGSVAVHPTIIFECIELPGNGDAEDQSSLPPLAVTAARVGRLIGSSTNEDTAGEDEEELDWSRIGTGAGGATAAWAADIADPSVPAAGDGLIWSGNDLNNIKKGKFLTGAASPHLNISRASANKAAIATSMAINVARAAGSTSGDVMREWGSREVSSPSTSVKPKERRHSGVSSVVGGFGAATPNDGDADSSAPGDDDTGSVTSQATTAIQVELDVDDATSASAQSSLRPYHIRRLELHTNPYKVRACRFFVQPVSVRLPPSVAVAIACGVDVLPGAASCFGLHGAPSPLAAASIEGGGMLSSSIMSGSGMASASGSVVSIKNALFACFMARLPYAHYGVAVSGPLPMHNDAKTPSLSTAAAATGTTAPGVTPGSPLSPTWIADLLSHGLGSSWSRLPIPLSPDLPAEAASRGILQVAQVAYTCATWAGNTIGLFVTAFLVSTAATVSTSNIPATTDIFGGAQQHTTCAWQASVQIRCEDARTRAVLAAEFADLVHTATCGMLSLVTHGHAPAPTSYLQHLEARIAADAESSNPAHRIPGNSDPIARAEAAATVADKLGIGIMPLAAAATGRELASEGRGKLANVRNCLGTSIFTVIPEDLLSLLGESSIPESEDLKDEYMDHTAHKILTGQLPLSPPASTPAAAILRTGAHATSGVVVDLFGVTPNHHHSTPSAAPTEHASFYDPFA